MASIHAKRARERIAEKKEEDKLDQLVDQLKGKMKPRRSRRERHSSKDTVKLVLITNQVHSKIFNYQTLLRSNSVSFQVNLTDDSESLQMKPLVTKIIK